MIWQNQEKIFFVSLTDHGIQNLLKAELEAKTGKEETKVTLALVMTFLMAKNENLEQ